MNILQNQTYTKFVMGSIWKCYRYCFLKYFLFENVLKYFIFLKFIFYISILKKIQ